MKTVIPSKISADEIKLIKAFVAMLRITTEFYEKPSMKTYPKFKEDIKPYFKYPFSKPVKARIELLDEEFGKIDTAKSNLPEVLNSFSADVAKLEAMFKAGNFKTGASFASTVNNKIESIKTSQVRHRDILKGRKNPFYVADPFFFQTTDFIRSFSVEDMKEIINKDYIKFSYSYLHFPKVKLDNFQFLVYFIQELKTDETPIELHPHQFNKYSDFLYMESENYGEFKKLIDKYLHSNDKKLIPKLLELLEELPELKAANEKLKKETKIVYRGIGGYSGEGERGEPTRADIEKEDKRIKYVACSSSRYVAERFAKMIGHLESGRRSDWGTVITYKVSPASIIFDTDTFGGIFGEDEVLIDATKAEIIDIYELGPKGYEDED
ncbi:MAG: hypothetical protein WC503_02960 [Candidatus Shapirobacteria bacterium]